MKKLLSTTIISLMLVSGVNSVAFANNNNNDDKITICHRNHDAKKPYVVETVDADAVDEDTANDNGKGDHAAEHQGPVASSEEIAQALKDAHQEWGDIIPAHDNFAGLNWDAAGKAVYHNDCNFASAYEESVESETPAPTVTETPSCTPTPEEVTPTETPEVTPTETPTETSSETPVENKVAGAHFEKSVLETGAMAETGSFTENLMKYSFIFGMLFLGLGSAFYAKAKN